MDKGIQIKGKNVEDAVELAAKELHTSKENIEYTVLEESNKTLFSILSPRYAIIYKIFKPSSISFFISSHIII